MQGKVFVVVLHRVQSAMRPVGDFKANPREEGEKCNVCRYINTSTALL